MSGSCCPVLLIFFNRPSVLRENLLALSEIRPQVIYLSCDGPRTEVHEDIYNLAECRHLAEKLVIWGPKVYRRYSDVNVGCDSWVPDSISWFLSNESEGIILEDDCIIGMDFYVFSSEMLSRYRNDTRIMNVSASNFFDSSVQTSDYYYSCYPSTWAWATWSRAWRNFDRDLKNVEFSNIRNYLEKHNFSEGERKFWARFFLRLKSGVAPFWDSKWVVSMWNCDGLSITPSKNLVTNIGFGPDATHTKLLRRDLYIAKQSIENIDQLSAPLPSFNSRALDFKLFKLIYSPKLLPRLFNLLKIIRKLIRF